MNTLEEMMTLHICILVGCEYLPVLLLLYPLMPLSLEDINNES